MEAQIVVGLFSYVVFLFSTTVHEAAHAWAAKWGGDLTAYHGGQVTLDPIPHIRREPFGTVVVPILSYILGGWMIGWASTPYDPLWAQRYPRRAAWMSLAGPLANLLLLLTAFALIRIGIGAGLFTAPLVYRETGWFAHLTESTRSGWGTGAAMLVSLLFVLNLLLVIFNLLPLPPLDGSSALALLLRPRAAERYLEFMRNPTFAWVGIIVAWNIFPAIFRPVLSLALRLLYFA